jgi:hypothetical protein
VGLGKVNELFVLLEPILVLLGHDVASSLMLFAAAPSKANIRKFGLMVLAQSALRVCGSLIRNPLAKFRVVLETPGERLLLLLLWIQTVRMLLLLLLMEVRPESLKLFFPLAFLTLLEGFPVKAQSIELVSLFLRELGEASSLLLETPSCESPVVWVALGHVVAVTVRLPVDNQGTEAIFPRPCLFLCGWWQNRNRRLVVLLLMRLLFTVNVNANVNATTDWRFRPLALTLLSRTTSSGARHYYFQLSLSLFFLSLSLLLLGTGVKIKMIDECRPFP